MLPRLQIQSAQRGHSPSLRANNPNDAQHRFAREGGFQKCRPRESGARTLNRFVNLNVIGVAVSPSGVVTDDYVSLLFLKQCN